MSTTIFCDFEQQDLADLAVGRLRDEIAGIKSIHYIKGYRTNSNIINGSVENTAWGGIFAMEMSSPPAPPRPVTVKIVCSDASGNAVIARLVNLHASRIVRTR